MFMLPAANVKVEAMPNYQQKGAQIAGIVKNFIDLLQYNRSSKNTESGPKKPVEPGRMRMTGSIIHCCPVDQYKYITQQVHPLMQGILK